MKNSKSSQIIAKARAGLIVDQPFFASLLLPMPISETEDVPTFATDGESIVYNPKWADTLSLPEITFVLAHEVLHCVFDHMGRRESRDHSLWNQAADYIINDLLVKEKIGSMPKGGLLDAALVAKGNGTAEGVYKILPKKDAKNKPGQPGGSLDSVLDAGGGAISKNEKGKTTVGQGKPVDAATAKQKASDLKVRVIQAKNAAKMQGRLSAGMERLIDDLVNPLVDWKEVLRRFVSERAKTDYSYARPKRRFLAEDIYLPSLTGEKMGALAIAVDCSYSVSIELLTKFATEINAIREDVNPSRIEVIYFDSDICGQPQVFEAEEEVKLEARGGGGTRFSPVFEKINSGAEMPVGVVFLTDLECSDFGPAPEYPVLWCVLEKGRAHNPPFGEVVSVKEDS